jgi:hypothetical protein
MTLAASPTTHEIGRGHGAPGAIYEARRGLGPRGRLGDAGILCGGGFNF